VAFVVMVNGNATGAKHILNVVIIWRTF